MSSLARSSLVKSRARATAAVPRPVAAVPVAVAAPAPLPRPPVVAPRAALESGSFDRLTDVRAAMKMSDEARFRRAHLAKYVKAVVAACGLVCVLAAARVVMNGAHDETGPSDRNGLTSKTPSP